VDPAPLYGGKTAAMREAAVKSHDEIVKIAGALP